MTSGWSDSRWAAAKSRATSGSGSNGAGKAVFIGAIPPFLLKTNENPEGLDATVFEEIQKAVAADPYAYFAEFFKNFYNTDLLLGTRVSEEVVRASWNIAAAASATASRACGPTWHEDFRHDVGRIKSLMESAWVLVCVCTPEENQCPSVIL